MKVNPYIRGALHLDWPFAHSECYVRLRKNGNPIFKVNSYSAEEVWNIF